jgi:hypothetical protein
MISLGIHQAATWGYSTYPHPTISTSDITGSNDYIGAFTKPTLAPNGNMYAILGAVSMDIGGTYKAFVIMKITPNTSNTGTANWQAATISYITADTGLAPLPNGFARPEWGAPVSISGGVSDNALFRFNTGILASNGLIYFPPVQCGSGNNYWVILDPAIDRWKVTNLLRPSGTTSITNRTIGCAVLGTDNKIYAIGGLGAKAFRITTSVNAGSDTVEDSFHTNFSTTNPMSTTTMTWRDSANNLYTDLASVENVTQAYNDAFMGAVSYAVFNRVTDAITHPSGKIFLIPMVGRGRVFYIDQSAWGTSLELVSAPGLSTADIPGYGRKTLSCYYAFIEKPRSADHNILTLKIFLVPRLPYGVNALNTTLDAFMIDPVTNEMTPIDMNYTNNAGSQTYQSFSKRHTLPNGMSISYNRLSTSGAARQGGMMLTGWDVPSTDTDAVRTIVADEKGILQDQTLHTLATTAPGFTGVGGGMSAKWPHNGKYIAMLDPVQNNVNIMELVSVKGYGPDITNFNFTSRDQTEYQIPTSLSQLGPSVYNSQFNKPR